MAGYFAFPRNGRNFVFPRMGRSGGSDSDDIKCCPEGVKGVFSLGMGVVNVCNTGDSCCYGYTEAINVYKDVLLIECVAGQATTQEDSEYTGRRK